MDLTLLLVPEPIVTLHGMAGHNVPQDQGASLKHMGGSGLLYCTAEVALQLAYNQFGQLGFIIFRHHSASCLDENFDSVCPEVQGMEFCNMSYFG